MFSPTLFGSENIIPGPRKKHFIGLQDLPSLLLSLALPLVILGLRMILPHDLSLKNGSKSSVHLKGEKSLTHANTNPVFGIREEERCLRHGESSWTDQSLAFKLILHR
jgi:hypothetical protein